MTTTWSSSLNDSGSSFIAEMGKDVPSAGSFQEDYLNAARTLKLITPCPFVTAIPSPLLLYQASSSSEDQDQSIPEKTVVRVSNCVVDLGSWRAILLAMSTMGSKIRELTCHGVQLGSEHLADLMVAVEKMNSLTAFNLEFVAFAEGDASSECNAALLASIQQILSGGVAIENISLKGCKLGDAFVSQSSSLLQSNLYLQTLNLSDNELSDVGATDLLLSLRMNPTLREITLSKNKLGLSGPGIFSAAFAALMTGSGPPAGADEDAFAKTLAKTVADRNKAIKDINKKKKLNPPIPDLPPPETRVFKGEGGINLIINKTLTIFDLSNNPGMSTESITEIFLGPYVQTLRDKGPAAVAASGAATIPFVVVCKGAKLSDEQISKVVSDTPLSPDVQFIFR